MAERLERQNCNLEAPSSIPAGTAIVSLAAFFSIVTQLWGGALRDDTKNGFGGD